MASSVHISITADTIGHLGPIPITSSLVNTWLVMSILVLVAVLVRLGLNPKKPGGLQNIMEMVVEGVLGAIQSVTGNLKQARLFFPVICTIFLFVLAQNWSGLIPGLTAIKVKAEHAPVTISEEFGTEDSLEPAAEAEAGHSSSYLFRSASADLSFTLALAIIAVILTQYHGIRQLGLFHYLGKFFNFKNPVMFFVGILELIGEAARLISFSFRLFGNIFAGKVLLAVMMMLVPFVLPIPFYGLELFVGLIQAVVFAALTAVFFKMATEHH